MNNTNPTQKPMIITPWAQQELEAFAQNKGFDQMQLFNAKADELVITAKRVNNHVAKKVLWLKNKLAQMAETLSDWFQLNLLKLNANWWVNTLTIETKALMSVSEPQTRKPKAPSLYKLTDYEVYRQRKGPSKSRVITINQGLAVHVQAWDSLFAECDY